MSEPKFRFSIYLLIICLEILSLNSVYAAGTQNLAGAIVSVSGAATVDTGGQGVKHRTKPGESVYEHDILATESGAALKLLLKDHSVVDLGSTTVFKIDEYRQNNGSDRVVVASTSQGTVRGSVTEKITGAGKFHLKTPSATMGVRGTEFVVDTPVIRAGEPPRASKITVLQGEVQVSNTFAAFNNKVPGSAPTPPAQSMSLKAGQQVTATANAPLPSQPVTLDSGSLKQISTTAKVADNTFSKAVVVETASNSSSSGQSSQSGQSQSSRAPASADKASGGDKPADKGPAGGAGPAPASVAAAPAPAAPAGGSMILNDIATAAAPATTAAAAPPPPPIQSVIPGVPQLAPPPPVSVVRAYSNITVVIH